MKMNVICLMQLGEYPVVTKSYDHEFLKSNSVTSFSQNNAVENYLKYQKVRVNNNYGLVPYNNGVVMIKKPISPNFDHSNSQVSDRLQTAKLCIHLCLCCHTMTLEIGSCSHLVFITEYHSKELYEIFC